MDIIVLILLSLVFPAIVLRLTPSPYPRAVKLAMFFTYATAMSLFIWQAHKAYVGMQNEKKERIHRVEDCLQTARPGDSIEKVRDSLRLMATKDYVVENYVTNTDSTIDIHLLLNNR